MAHITPNPEAEADLAFENAQPGPYRMRIEGSPNMPAVQGPLDSKTTPGNKIIKVRLVFSDPTSIVTDKGTMAKNLGSIIDSSLVVEPATKQGKLRGLVESAGINWAIFNDTDMLIGREVLVQVSIEEYQGEKRNKVARYLKQG